ncbi:DNA polymerase III subunit gamma/tau [Acerihabitans arboris]|uniref:DNA polymerase III subunit gamma/tau n=1 Tax=Acerihabitans arboris TaxID=2691583 RepID=A0A845SPF0_9GAMM|nr:DNA polymerase III subunit gamma/tau [Acerihabitans arboris]NDL65037.1 DNA polymerase III subunit gamma/tau [Acerihabitans arboris]
MSYQVLARKWRPQTFSDVVGQEHVLTALTNGLSLGRIHHAYLFSGTRGVGKTTIARLLAKGLNCETGITSSPCGHCANCREIEQGRFVDLIEIDAASRTKVEDTRDLLDNVQYAPARGRFKVYLIDEVHMLSRHSFNALLKTLEEPPSHVKFLLATTDPQKLPVTILSRCLQFHLKALDVGQIRAQLEHILQAENIDSEPRALRLLARAADGSLRDALSLTDQAIAMGMGQVTTQTVGDMLGTLNTEQPLALIEALVAADGNAMMAQLAQCASRGVDWETLLVEMLTQLHRVAMGQLLPDALEDEEDAAVAPRLRELARLIPPTDLQLYYQTLLVGRKELPFAPDRRLGVEMTLLRALAFHPRIIEAAPAPASPAQAAASTEKKTAESAALTPNRINNRRVAPENAAPPAGQGRQMPAGNAVLPADQGRQMPAGNAVLPSDQGRQAGKPAVSAPGPQDAAGQERAPMPDEPPDDWESAEQYANSAGDPAADDIADSIYAYQADEAAGHIPAPGGAGFSAGEDPAPSAALPDSTAQLLQARTALMQRHGNQSAKKSDQASSPARPRPANSALERLATVSEQAQQRQAAGGKVPAGAKTVKPEAYRWKASIQPTQAIEPVATPKALRTALEHEKTPELAARLAEESIVRDPWAALVDKLKIPKLVQQLALNAFREDLAPGKVCLHLRSAQQHLNSPVSQATLAEALSGELGAPVELTVVTDDNPAIRTPLEWRQAIYEEKLMQARQAIIADNNIQTLQRFFDAELDEDSIRPV